MMRSNLYILPLGQDMTYRPRPKVGPNTAKRLERAVEELHMRIEQGHAALICMAPGAGKNWPLGQTFGFYMAKYLRRKYPAWFPTVVNASDVAVWGTEAEVRFVLEHAKNHASDRPVTLVLVADRRHLRRAKVIARHVAEDMYLAVNVRTIEVDHPPVPLLHECGAWVKVWWRRYQMKRAHRQRVIQARKRA